MRNPAKTGDVSIPPLTSFSRGLSEAVVVLGLLALVGWRFDVVIVKSVLPDLKAMNPTSAIAFACSGISLLLLFPRQRSSKLFRQISAVLAAVVVVIGVMKALTFFGLTTGVDEILFTQEVNSAPLVGTMAPNTALGFIFVGIALLFLHFERRHLYRPAHFLALATIVPALFSFTGYLFGVSQLYGGGDSVPMALNTSLAFMFLALGIIFSRPDRGLFAMQLLPKVTVAMVSFGATLFMVISFSVYANTLKYLQKTAGSIQAPYPEEISFSALTATMGVMSVAAPLFLLIIISFLIVIRVFLKPVRSLTSSTRAIAGGDFSKRVDVASKDELGVLAQSFNDMAGRLQELYRGLDQKVKIRTAQLADKVKVITDQNKVLEVTKQAIQKINEDLRQEKTKIAEEQAKDEAMLASIAEGVTITDAMGSIVMINQAAENMLGWKSSEVTGRKFDEVVPLVNAAGKIVPLEQRHFFKSLSTGASAYLPVISPKLYYYMRKDKSIFPIAGSTAPIMLNNNIIGAIGVFSDITREKEIDQAKSEFVSLASHQLQSPLSSINWYAELLMSGESGRVTVQQKKHLQEIYLASKTMSRLVNALLNVSRLEMGTFTIDPVPLRILEVVKDVFNEFKQLVKRKNLRLTHTSKDTIPKINADPNLLRIILQNLIGNAIKYTPAKGTVSVTISKERQHAKVRSTGAGNILITIVDTGIGIPEYQKSQIFTKLFRGDNAREMESTGTGLGLYIVKSILDRTNGKIWFDSTKNKGTTFFVSLPQQGMKKKEGTRQLVSSTPASTLAARG